MERLRQSRRLPGPLIALATIALAACNSITGVDSLVLYGDNSPFDDEGGGGAADTGAGAADPTGGGRDPSATTGAGGVPGGHAGGSGSTTTSSTSTSTSASTSTSSGGPVDCEYPTSGFGVNIGNHVQGNLAWQGYAEGADSPGTISIQDYFDCDGSKGINALLIVSSATWCGACQQEAADLPSHAAAFAQKGIRVLTLMVENAAGQPATLSTATSWRSNFGLEDYATAADPNFTFAGSGSIGIPLQIVVDPRTMVIVNRTEGFGGYSAVTQLANKNAP